eukprot:1026766-Prymnesium_polylepis.2
MGVFVVASHGAGPGRHATAAAPALGTLRTAEITSSVQEVGNHGAAASHISQSARTSQSTCALRSLPSLVCLMAPRGKPSRESGGPAAFGCESGSGARWLGPHLGHAQQLCARRVVRMA